MIAEPKPDECDTGFPVQPVDYKFGAVPRLTGAQFRLSRSAGGSGLKSIVLTASCQFLSTRLQPALRLLRGRWTAARHDAKLHPEALASRPLDSALPVTAQPRLRCKRTAGVQLLFKPQPVLRGT